MLYQAELLPDELIVPKTEPNETIVATSGCSDGVCRFLLTPSFTVEEHRDLAFKLLVYEPHLLGCVEF